MFQLSDRQTKDFVHQPELGMGYQFVEAVKTRELFVLLNAYAFGLHAAPGMTWAAWLLGAVIPGLVYALGRVAGHLWQAGE